MGKSPVAEGIARSDADGQSAPDSFRNRVLAGTGKS